MTRWAPHLYRKEGERQDVDPNIINKSLWHTNILNDKGLLPVLSLGHLSFLTDIPYWKLRFYVARRLETFGPGSIKHYKIYRSFQIKKKSGGFRRICVPNQDLLKVQRYIDRFILGKIKAGPYSYAFEKGQSIVDCAQQHLGCKWLIKIDLRNFFESLSEIQVYRVFREHGYQSLISFELARICTKESQSAIKNQSRWWKNGHKAGIESYHSDKIGHLPQGAPTSPKLANLIVKSLDTEIACIAETFGLVYTRYADDLTLSTDSDAFNRKSAKEIIRKIYEILPKHGLMPHPQKTQIVPPGARKVVLGLLVDGDNVRLSKEFRSKLECHWYFCAKNPIGHANQRGFDSLFGLKNYLNGLIAYARQIDLAFVNKLQVKFGVIKWPI